MINVRYVCGTDANAKLTSWELLNYILKGVTCELIELGAKQELKTVVLQLWATYLRNLEVAFTSVDVERKPKLGYAFKRRYFMLYTDPVLILKSLAQVLWELRNNRLTPRQIAKNKSELKYFIL